MCAQVLVFLLGCLASILLGVLAGMGGRYGSGRDFGTLGSLWFLDFCLGPCLLGVVMSLACRYLEPGFVA